MHIDPETKKIFFFEESTQTTSFEHPGNTTSSAAVVTESPLQVTHWDPYLSSQIDKHVEAPASPEPSPAPVMSVPASPLVATAQRVAGGGSPSPTVIRMQPRGTDTGTAARVVDVPASLPPQPPFSSSAPTPPDTASVPPPPPPAAIPDTLFEAARQYVRIDPNADTRLVVAALLEAVDAVELGEILGKRLAFGTAGLRGPMGPGYNRMNDLVILQTTQGLARHLAKQHGEAGKARGVVIGYDHRKLGTLSSLGFARMTAAVLLSQGFKVRYLESPPGKPFSFSSRLLNPRPLLRASRCTCWKATCPLRLWPTGSACWAPLPGSWSRRATTRRPTTASSCTAATARRSSRRRTQTWRAPSRAT